MSHHHPFSDEGGSRGILKSMAGKQFFLRRDRAWSESVAVLESPMLFSVSEVIVYLCFSLLSIGEPLARWLIKKNTKDS